MNETTVLRGTTHEHHELIHAHVDRLPELAAMLDRDGPAQFTAAFEQECAFVIGQLVPHMAAVENALYDELEGLMAGRHSMAPMRDEHELLRRLISSLCGYRAQLLAGGLSEGEEIGLRRVLYRLYAVLKVHLAEEEGYLGVLEDGLDPGQIERLARGIEHATAEPL